MKIESLEHIMDLPINYLTKEQRQQALLQIRKVRASTKPMRACSTSN